jgi:hypothetical protein
VSFPFRTSSITYLMNQPVLLVAPQLLVRFGLVNAGKSSVVGLPTDKPERPPLVGAERAPDHGAL